MKYLYRYIDKQVNGTFDDVEIGLNEKVFGEKFYEIEDELT